MQQCRGVLRRSFLDSLKGLTLVEAQRRVRSAGFKVSAYSRGVAAIALAQPDVVMLWLATDDVNIDSIVELATAGDPTQLGSDAT